MGAAEMDCDTATPLIEALCDDELDVASAARLVAHLEGCGACAALRRDVETRKAVLREARPVDCLPDAVRTRLLREVGRSGARPAKGWRGRVVPLGLAACLVAGGLAAVLALRERSPGRRRSPTCRW